MRNCTHDFNRFSIIVLSVHGNSPFPIRHSQFLFCLCACSIHFQFVILVTPVSRQYLVSIRNSHTVQASTSFISICYHQTSHTKTASILNSPFLDHPHEDSVHFQFAILRPPYEESLHSQFSILRVSTRRESIERKENVDIIRIENRIR